MNRLICVLSAGIFIVACNTTPTPTPVGPTPTVAFSPTLMSPSGYRPMQMGDQIEGAPISYQYVLPSLEQPGVTLAFSTNLFQLVLVKPEMTDGLLEYVREIAKSTAPVLAYDESTPSQTEPKLMTFDGSKPVELAFIQLVEGTHYWSVTETDENGVQAAYKIVRRRDGGLRFIDAYGIVALHSAAGMFTLNGGGLGLFFSSRLALLKVIMKEQKYQLGTDVFTKYPVENTVYDKRVMVIDTTRLGPAQNRDWVLVSRPGPDTGLQ